MEELEALGERKPPPRHPFSIQSSSMVYIIVLNCTLSIVIVYITVTPGPLRLLTSTEIIVFRNMIILQKLQYTLFNSLDISKYLEN